MAEYVNVQGFIRISIGAMHAKMLSCNFCTIVVSFLCPNDKISRVKFHVDEKKIVIRAIYDTVVVDEISI